MKRLVSKISGLAILTALSLTPALLSGTVSASALAMPTPRVVADAKGDACAGIGLTGADCTGTDAQKQANGIISTGLNYFGIAVGIAGVVMVMLAGMKYITSSGDPSKIAGAKTTLIYALVGLAVAAGSETIVHFVIGNS